jgi:glycosyltransferase involved in cell wall biosynthesis
VATIRQFPVKLIEQNHRGPGMARNRGAAESAGDILIFIDADMEFHPEFLAKLVAPIIEGNTIGTFTKEEYVLNYEKLWARYWNIVCGIHDRRKIPPDYPDESVVFRAIRKDKFLEIGGFDDKGVQDDTTLSKKLGVLSIAAPGAICYHRNPETLSEVFRDARWYARGGVFHDQAENAAPLKKSLMVAWREAKIMKERRFFIFKVVFYWGVRRGLEDYHSGKVHIK